MKTTNEDKTIAQAALDLARADSRCNSFAPSGAEREVALRILAEALRMRAQLKFSELMADCTDDDIEAAAKELMQ